ncbi:tetratricopeptide (TPR) repeat protein [Actinokineospora baliensis]|uniref:tetratricopeptide repeat protein n=1 Tax=Actinokineospora baliensis TaxID=547056 RepID=UPI00195759F3|nr:tetratricopeptide repeat protein [Actinokineospora baliensis]MBM7774431.1 tetratricopeptide (TPR) repeat protein [Actinokineospora baliensis]
MVEARNELHAATVANSVQAHTIGTVHLHQHTPVAIPRQLPMAPRGFIGRAEHLAELDARTGIVVISAAGGAGKTWLAVTWAHRNLDRFPDGQLAVDLRGFSPDEPQAPFDVLGCFLVALGIDPNPLDLDARGALYRTHTAGKTMLVLLDNAFSAGQVAPLLPGGDTCTVVITSRGRLTGLLARHGAHSLRVGMLTNAEARTLLTSAQVAPEAIADLTGLCRGFPLVLGLIAARVRTSADRTDLADDLTARGLDALADDDPAASLPTVLSWSLHRLTDEQRTVFGLLGVAPGPDTTATAVISLVALPAARVHGALAALEEASLVERHHGRYSMHDLVRSYAATTVTAGRRGAALSRLIDFYVRGAHTADRLLNPHGPVLHADPALPGVTPLRLPDSAAAATWFAVEHPTLLACQRTAARLGRHQAVWDLAWTLNNFHLRCGHLYDSLTSWQAALGAAAHLGEPAVLSRSHRCLGRAYSRLSRHTHALEHLNQALDLAVRHHDRTEQAHTHRVIAFLWGRLGDHRQALAHAHRSLDLYRTLNRPVWEADALNSAGWYSAHLGEFDAALDLCRAALALQRDQHDPDGEASILDSLGFIAHLTGDHRQALSYYNRALDRYRATGNTYFVAFTLGNLGHPHAALGQQDRARASWREALEMFEEQGRDTDAARLRHLLAP